MRSLVADALRRFAVGADEQLVLAVSGGVDSMTLLALLTMLAHDGLLKMPIALHVNHNIRPAAQTKRDHLLIQAYCQKNEIAYHYRNCSPRFLQSIIGAERGGVEAAARTARLRLISDFLAKQRLRLLCTAHHADDHAETVLMRLFQGAGMRGMEGIAQKKEMRINDYSFTILRPLSFATKEQIYRWAHAQRVPYNEDETNAESRFTRNILRNTIIPAISSHFPNIVPSLERLAAQQRIDNAYIRRQAAHILPWKRYRSGYTIPSARFFGADRALQIESLYSLVSRRRIPYRFIHHSIFGNEQSFIGTRARGHGVHFYCDGEHLYWENNVAKQSIIWYTVIIDDSAYRYRMCTINIQLFDATQRSVTVQNIDAPLYAQVVSDRTHTRTMLYDRFSKIAMMHSNTSNISRHTLKVYQRMNKQYGEQDAPRATHNAMHTFTLSIPSSILYSESE